MEFDQQLIERTKRYFYSRLGLELSDEAANDYLSQFAELYASMAVFAATEAPASPLPDPGTRFTRGRGGRGRR